MQGSVDYVDRPNAVVGSPKPLSICYFTAIFRVHMTINEPYTGDYTDMKTEAFEWLAGNITLSLNAALKQYGTYVPRVVAIEWVVVGLAWLRKRVCPRKWHAWKRTWKNNEIKNSEWKSRNDRISSLLKRRRFSYVTFENMFFYFVSKITVLRYPCVTLRTRA